MVRAHPMFYVTLGLVCVLFLLILLPFWAYALGGALLAYISFPLYKRVLAPLGQRKGLAAAIALVVTVIVILLPFGFLSYQLVIEAQELGSGLSANETKEAISGAANWSTATFGWPTPNENETAADVVVDSAVPKLRQAFLSWLPGAASYLAELTVGLTLALFLAYYMVKDGPELVQWAEDAMPLDVATEKRLLSELKATMEAVLLGQVATGLAIGIIGGIGFWIFGVPAPIFWGFVMAVMSLVPVVGATLVWGGGAIYLFAFGHVYAGIGMVLWGLLLLSSVDNVVKPMVIGQRSGMHPGVALVAVVGGLVAFGFMGFVVGPLIAGVFVLMVNAYIELRRYDPSVPELPPDGDRNGDGEDEGSNDGPSDGDGAEGAEA